MGRNKSVGIGRIGEDMARIRFRQEGWTMFRVQPETRVIMIKGKPVVVPVRSSSLEEGIADFMGYVVDIKDPTTVDAILRVCEAKAVRGRTCPPSTFKRQHDWLMKIPEESRYVYVWWYDYGVGVLARYIGQGFRHYV